MSNYLVDASVYALPKQIPSSPDEETIKLFDEYLENMNKLFELIGFTNNNLRVNYFLFCSSDIGFLINSNLFLNDDTKKNLRYIGIQRKNKLRLDDLEMFFQSEIVRLRWAGKSNKPEKVSTVESYIGVDDIKTMQNCSYKPDLSNDVENLDLAEKLKKNINILSFFNQCVFKANDITKIITNSKEDESDIDIEISDIKHIFNNIPHQGIKIASGKVINRNLHNLIQRKFVSIDEAIQESAVDFNNTIEYSNSINNSINEYKNDLTLLEEQFFGDKKEKIKTYIMEYPIIVYDSIAALDKLVKYHRSNGGSNPHQAISKNFNCESIGKNDICNKCCGYLRLCGFECSDEYDRDLRHPRTIQERTIDGQLFRIHLKPYKVMGGTQRADLSLRIYFRWDTNKIKIGRIGRHPWLPPKKSG